MSDIRVGLVATGGGARAAYQVGALQAIAEILHSKTSPFSVLTGVSAGAINASAIAAEAHDFQYGVSRLVETWKNLTPDQVFKTNPFSLIRLGSKWIKDLSSGGILGNNTANFLLDTTPLREMLEKRIAFSQIKKSVEDQFVRGVAVSATNYLTGTAITFFEGSPEIDPWTRGTRMGKREDLTVEHVMASSAIPVFFPPVKMDRVFYGDGCIRLGAPLSPAIHLGANRLVAIGIRFFRTHDLVRELNQQVKRDSLSVSDIGGVLLNAVFLDSLESDLERLARINNTLRFVSKSDYSHLPQSLRPIPFLALRPSRDLGELASTMDIQNLPKFFRYLLRGIGTGPQRGWDLVSYLAFEPSFVGRLLELGYEDTLKRSEEIERLFLDESLDAHTSAF